MQTKVITDNVELLDLYPTLMSRPFLAIDTETTGLSCWEDVVVGVALSWDGETGYYLPFGHKDDPSNQCSPPVVKWVMEGVLRNPNITKIFHNAKFDIHLMMTTFGIRPVMPFHDTIVMAFMTDNTVPKNLKDWSARLFGPELKVLEGKLKAHQKAIRAPSYAHCPVSVIGPYAGGDAVYTFKLFEHFSPTVLNMSLYHTERDLINLLIDMERRGVLIDTDFLEAAEGPMRAELPKVEAQIEAIAGHPVNPRSPQQVALLLYGEMGMPVLDYTDTGNPSTAEEILLNLPRHEVIDLILRARALSKVISTYVFGILDKVDGDNRLHARFNALGAETGRFSSSKPNLQNIPREGSMPISIRGAFIPSPGHAFAFIDYSQVEMRIFAHYSNDPGLLEAVLAGFDFHRSTASIIFNKPPERVTKEERKFAKTVNFGYIYGIGSKKLAHRLQVSVGEARRFLKTYNAKFPGVPVFMSECRREFEARKYVENAFGRRRKIPYDKGYRSVNTLVQGTAADVIKDAMVRLIPLISTTSAKCLMQIHDELIFEIPFADMGVVPEIQRVMEDFRFRVPLNTGTDVSSISWGDKSRWTTPMEVMENCELGIM